MNANSTFCITDGIFCGISGSFSQAIRKEESETERLIYLQCPVYGGGVSVSFKRNGIGKVHSGKLEVSVKTKSRIMTSNLYIRFEESEKSLIHVLLSFAVYI